MANTRTRDQWQAKNYAEADDSRGGPLTTFLKSAKQLILWRPPTGRAPRKQTGGIFALYQVHETRTEVLWEAARFEEHRQIVAARIRVLRSRAQHAPDEDFSLQQLTDLETDLKEAITLLLSGLVPEERPWRSSCLNTAISGLSSHNGLAGVSHIHDGCKAVGAQIPRPRTTPSSW